jgi:hypothetical protein
MIIEDEGPLADADELDLAFLVRFSDSFAETYSFNATFTGRYVCQQE